MMLMTEVPEPPVDIGLVPRFMTADGELLAALQDEPVGVLRAEGLTRMVSDYLTGAVPRSGGRPIEIAVTVDLQTALGHRDLPGEVPGRGIVPRDTIAELIRREAPRLRLLVIDEATGRLLHRPSDTYRPTPEQIAQVNATYVHSVGPGSTILADRCDTDHITAWPHGATVIGNLAPLDRPWHNDKTHRSLRVTIDDTDAVTITTPLGQSRTVTPYDYRASKNTTPGDTPATNPATDQTPPPF